MYVGKFYVTRGTFGYIFGYTILYKKISESHPGSDLWLASVLPLPFAFLTRLKSIF